MKNKIPETATIIPSDFIIIGGTGHLSMSKIIPALFWRFIDKQIDQKSNIILCDREIKSKENFEKLQKIFCAEAFERHKKNHKYWENFLKIISNKGTIAYDKNIVQLENRTEISGKVNEKVIFGKAIKVDIDLNKRNLSSNELIIFIDEYEISVKEIILNEDEIVFKGSPIYLRDNKGLETETSMVKLKSNGELIFPSKLNIKNY